MSLLDCNIQELKEMLVQSGETPFRAKQIMQWLVQGAPFENMTNLSLGLRGKLRAEFDEGYAKIVHIARSVDGTKKYLLRLADGNAVESVYMPKHYGNTICVSTQVGCRMGCVFCASGANGLIRNLTPGEMLAQVIAVNADQDASHKITHIVLMGMGEPLDNYENVVKFLRLVNSADGLGIGMRNISLSTCGLAEQMDRFTQEGIPLTLSVSLHAATDEKRQRIMPVAKRYTVLEVIQAANRYFLKTGRRIIIEYAVIEGFNDGQEDAAALRSLLHGMNCHINLIPLNGNDGLALHAPSKSNVYAFCEELSRVGLSATVRKSMGGDIKGACGQLRQQYLEQ